MNENITIENPSIFIYGEKARLQASIVNTNFQKEYYFEVDNKYRKYLCRERSDAFLLGILYFALVNGYDIKCKAPVSEKLYYQITTVYIPTVVKNCKGLFKPIEIEAETTNVPIKNNNGVGASVSGGIDSFYTIIRNLKQKTEDYNITHLVVTNCFNIYHKESDNRKRFERICNKGRVIADDLNLDFIAIYTNEHLFWFPHFMNLYCFRYCALPYALQKLFAVYNYSGGHPFEDFTFNAPNLDASYYDFFTAQLISSENLTIYSSGGEQSRVGKAGFIADNPVVQKHLQVCNYKEDNCSVCDKCMRTQFNLYACGKLDLFKNVFDLQKFEINKKSEIVKMYRRNNYFDREILNMMRTHSIRIPTSLMILGYIERYIKKIARVFTPLNRLIQTVKPKQENQSVMSDIERYSIDHDFAKKCDPEII